MEKQAIIHRDSAILLEADFLPYGGLLLRRYVCTETEHNPFSIILTRGEVAALAQVFAEQAPAPMPQLALPPRDDVPAQDGSILLYEVQAQTVLDVAEIHWQNTHPATEPWGEEAVQQCLAAIKQVSVDASWVYADHATVLARLPEVAAWFPPLETAPPAQEMQ